jgi:hypothetical protein
LGKRPEARMRERSSDWLFHPKSRRRCPIAMATACRTRATFLAVLDEPTAEYVLLRVLQALETQTSETILFITVYGPRAQTVEQAEALAKRTDLPVAAALRIMSLNTVLAGTWHIVWFRSLTAEEREAYQ